MAAFMALIVKHAGKEKEYSNQWLIFHQELGHTDTKAYWEQDKMEPDANSSGRWILSETVT